MISEREEKVNDDVSFEGDVSYNGVDKRGRLNQPLRGEGGQSQSPFPSTKQVQAYH